MKWNTRQDKSLSAVLGSTPGFCCYSSETGLWCLYGSRISPGHLLAQLISNADVVEASHGNLCSSRTLAGVGPAIEEAAGNRLKSLS